MKKLIKNNLSIQYKIEIKKIKHTYLRIKDGYVLVTTNKKMQPVVEQFLNEQFDKLYEKLKKQTKIDNHTIQIRGVKYSFKFLEGIFSYQIINDQVIAYGVDIESTKKLIYLSELKQMMADVHPKVIKVIAARHLHELPIKYKYLKSKFGSYHRKHDEITLNTFLATLDEKYLEYVLYHEYAHKIQFNHSKDFYDILDSWMIGHKNIQKALKKMVII
ncbi:MAG: M48 family metallopeptidase [Acholeplasmataceae bacterium]